MTTFTDLQISDEIIRAMEGMGWVEPTPVQMAVIPEGLKGGDLFAQAQTGTGKTGTYGTIVLERTRAGARAPSTLVLVRQGNWPTRCTRSWTSCHPSRDTRASRFTAG
ncbi:MAG TPA: DEAD/DEAH box helicase [Methanomassiliicoccaceae archaeon]|nr:DEAD/DEAH box helicase [Methanomassiliicoccaceae archaeon]